MSHDFPVAKVAVTEDALIVRDVSLADAHGGAGPSSVAMVVGAVTYQIAKTIKVKVGADIYLLPLFGPVAP